MSTYFLLRRLLKYSGVISKYEAIIFNGIRQGKFGKLLTKCSYLSLLVTLGLNLHSF